jgi:hypothetical protein
MARTSTQTKPRKVATKTAAVETEEHLEAFPKTKKAIDIEEPEAVLGTALAVEEKEEKLDEDGMPITEEEDEAAADEAVIDDEEVNPFGDKWEE